MTPTNQVNMSLGYEVSDGDRWTRNIYNPTAGDKVVPQRIDQPVTLTNQIVSSYLEFIGITTPSSAPLNRVRLYSKTTGTDTHLFVILDTGVEKELASLSGSFSLDEAYNNGSIVSVDATDVDWRLTAPEVFKITNAAGTTDRFQVSNTRTDIQTLRINTAYTLPSADGTSNQVMTTNGAGVLSFSSISSIGDATYLRLDASNDPLTGGLAITQAAGTGTVVGSLVATDGAHTALTASTERPSIYFNLSSTQQFATGALAVQRAVRIAAPTYAFVGASTLTDASTVAISGAPIKGTNATITTTHGLLIQAGAVSTAAAAYGLTVNTPTGATVNYAAQFLGGLTILGGGANYTKTTATIATGVITYASGYMQIDTEAAAASDDLDTITAGVAIEGTQVILKSTNNGRVPTVKDGTGNIRTNGDFALANVNDRITLLFDGTNWCELSRSTNS